MKIALSQQNYIIGNFEHNYNKIENDIIEASKQNAELVVFPELAVCGYPPRDFLEFPDFINKCLDTIEKVCQLSKSHNIAVIIGSPTINPVPEGKDLFNSAYFINEGEIKHKAHKTLLPTYDIFDEYRYFEPVSDFKIVEFKGIKLAITVCEDIWNIANENPLYTICPMDELSKQNPDLMINISASPFDYSHKHDRYNIILENVKRYKIPMVYVNSVGTQTEVIFDGGSIVMNEKGGIHTEMPYFKEALQIIETDELYGEHTATSEKTTPDKYELIHNALVLGIQDYFGKLGFKKAILGLSGGIDSALTLALAAEALGPENVLSVLMPSKYSSDHSVNDSVQMCKNLESPHKIISIEDPNNAFLKILEPHFEGIPFNVAEENIQARCRGLILMALSNKLGHIVLNTSNKSEAAVGYGTLYGDMCGGLSVIGDVYKVEVYELSKYINKIKQKEIIPVNIIEKAPSAELRPNQFDSDSLPPYEQLDTILYEYIENRQGPKEIIEKGYDPKMVERILRLVNRSEYKRYQTPPMLRISRKAFGMGRRLPIVAKYLG